MVGEKGGRTDGPGATGLREAFMASPGPRTPRQAVGLWLKGVCMGTADIIPGVSGGTIALITGIYDDLIDAIRSFDPGFALALVRLRLSEALSRAHLRFLVVLLLGIGTALVGMSRVMHHLLTDYPVQIWSLFFGLIAASIPFVWKQAGPVRPVNLLAGALGAVGCYALVGLVPVQTPENAWFLFLCGALAICAMILPGISGAFILLLLGKYEFVTKTLKNPFLPENMMIIMVFGAGAAVGIVVFSRFLHYLLERWRGQTIAVLAGFMVGALRKVWPWKDVLETATIGNKTFVLREANVLPPAFDQDALLALGLMVLGAAAVIVLERLAGTRIGADR